MFVTHIHFRDVDGKLLWVEDTFEDSPLFVPGEALVNNSKLFRIERVAVADNVQHVNLRYIPEDVNIVEPFL